MGQENDVRLQSSIGDMRPFDRKDQAMNGMIAVARIIKLHYTHHTADIQLITNHDVMVGTTIKNGKDAVQLCERQAGWDETYETYYGNITPYRVGQLVLVVFAELMKDRPFIIGTIHEVKQEHNPFPLEEYSEADEKHLYECLKIGRLQDYWYFNGVSEMEVVHHSHSYLVSRESAGARGSGIDDTRTGFKWENLYVKNKNTGQTLSLPEEKRQSVPMDYLLHFASGPTDDAKFLRIWVSSLNSEIRMTQDLNDNNLSMMSIDQTGRIMMSRKLNCENSYQGGDYAEVVIETNGDIKLNRVSGAGQSTILVTPSTVKVNTTKVIVEASDSIKMNAGGNIDMTAGGQVTITAPTTVVQGGDFYTKGGNTYLEC